MKKIFSSMFILFLFLFANVNAKTVTDLTGKKVTIKDNPSRIAIVPIPWASLTYVVDGDSSKIVGIHPSAKKSYEISILKELAPDMKNVNSVFVDNNFNINYEELALLKPDLVVVWDYQNDAIEKLNKLKIPAVAIKYGTLEDVQEGIKLLENGDKKYNEVKIKDDEMNIMLFTSGTTDRSKIVMLTQAGIMSNVYSIQFHVEITTKDTLLSFLPIHHTFENTITILLSMYKGGTVAFCDGLRYIADNLKEYKITIFVAVPLVMETMYKKIQKGLAEKGKDKLIAKMIKISNSLLKLHIDLRKIIFKPIHAVFGGHLKKVLYGSASISKDTIIAYNNWGINLIQGYGLTETSPVLTAESETRHKIGSAGFCIINQELKIENPDKDGIGEIVAKGKNIMLGYYNDEEKTKEAFTEDGFFKTGDYGYIDKDGFLFITGRKKDIIVLRNGKNVYPQELEFLITKLDYVLECIVFPRNKDKTDTVIQAKIVYDKDRIKQIYGEKTEGEYKKDIWKDIKEINKNLVTYKHIKEIEITDIPMEKTTTQKIKRYVEIEKENKK